MNSMTFPFQGNLHVELQKQARHQVHSLLPERALKIALVFALHAGVLALALHLPPISTVDFIHARAEMRPIEISLLRATIATKPPEQHVAPPHVEPAKPLPKKVQPIATQPAATQPVPATAPRTEPAAAPVSASTASTASAKSDATPASATPTALPLVAAHVDANYSQKTAPAYPAMSRRLHEEGKVQLLVRVSAQGNVDAIEIRQSSGYSRLDEVALNTVRAWRFVPARRGDAAVADSVVVPILFKLND